jgi:uncharacterized membrane protein YGL010W
MAIAQLFCGLQVPLLLFSFVCIFEGLQLPLVPFFLLNGFAILYVAMDTVGAVLTSSWMLLTMTLGKAFAVYCGGGKAAITVGIAVHLGSWFMQIVMGHGMMEGKTPAFFDSLFQSYVMAPLLVTCEFMFLLGMRFEMQEQLRERVEAAYGKFVEEETVIIRGDEVKEETKADAPSSTKKGGKKGGSTKKNK